MEELRRRGLGLGRASIGLTCTDITIEELGARQNRKNLFRIPKVSLGP